MGAGAGPPPPDDGGRPMIETDDFPADVSDDPRLVTAVREYQAALDAGRPPDRAAFLARHAAIAGELADCLDGLSLLTGLLPGAEGDLPPGVPLGDFDIQREVGRGGM